MAIIVYRSNGKEVAAEFEHLVQTPDGNRILGMNYRGYPPPSATDDGSRFWKGPNWRDRRYNVDWTRNSGDSWYIDATSVISIRGTIEDRMPGEKKNENLVIFEPERFSYQQLEDTYAFHTDLPEDDPVVKQVNEKIQGLISALLQVQRNPKIGWTPVEKARNKLDVYDPQGRRIGDIYDLEYGILTKDDEGRYVIEGLEE